MKLWPVLTGIALSFTLIACKAPTPPKGVQPITNFDTNRYEPPRVSWRVFYL